MKFRHFVGLLIALTVACAAVSAAPVPVTISFSSSTAVEDSSFLSLTGSTGRVKFQSDTALGHGSGNVSTVWQTDGLNYSNLSYRLSVDTKGWSYPLPVAGTNAALTAVAPVNTTATLRIYDANVANYFDVTFQLHTIDYSNGAFALDGAAAPVWTNVPTFGNNNLLSYQAFGGVGNTGFENLKAVLSNPSDLGAAQLAFVTTQTHNLLGLPEGGASYLGSYDVFLNVLPTPEPAFYGLLAAGMSGLFAFAWRRKRTEEEEK